MLLGWTVRGLMYFFGLLTLVLQPGPLSAQAALSPADGAGRQLQPVAMSTEMRYGLLFRQLVLFENQADRLSGQGKPSAFLRSHWKDHFGLSEQLHSVLLATAKICVAQVDVLDRQAATIIQAAKASFGNRPRGTVLPVGPVPPELLDLENRRREVVEAAVGQLAAAFGPAQFGLFDLAVKTTVGQQLALAPPAPQQ